MDLMSRHPLASDLQCRHESSDKPRVLPVSFTSFTSWTESRKNDGKKTWKKWRKKWKNMKNRLFPAVWDLCWYPLTGHQSPHLGKCGIYQIGHLKEVHQISALEAHVFELFGWSTSGRWREMRHAGEGDRKEHSLPHLATFLQACGVKDFKSCLMLFDAVWCCLMLFAACFDMLSSSFLIFPHLSSPASTNCSKTSPGRGASARSSQAEQLRRNSSTECEENNAAFMLLSTANSRG